MWDTGVVSVCEEVVSTIQIRAENVHYHLSRLRQVSELWAGFLKCFSPGVKEDIEKISICAVSHCESFHPPFGRLLWHILLSCKTPSEADHGFVDGDVATGVIAGLELGDERLEYGLHFVHLEDLLPWLSMAYVKHPKYLLKSVPRENTTEERDLTRPGRLPVIFQFRKVDDPHIDDNCKEAMEFTDRHWLPLCKPGSWRQLPLGLQLTEALVRIPVCIIFISGCILFT